MKEVNVNGEFFIRVDDYLEVVMEKEVLENTIKMYKLEHEKIEKGLKEKDEEIERLRISLNNSIKETCERNKELLKQDKKIEDLEKQNEFYAKEYERMKNLYEPEKQYEEWCELKYWYDDVKTGDIKMYRQHMNYEEACELIGMDSDNWNAFKVVKYKKEVE